MLLGKRGRPKMRRATSMTGITVDVGSNMDAPAPPREQQNPISLREVQWGPTGGGENDQVVVGSGLMSGYEYDQRLTAMVLSPRYNRSLGSDQVETAQFLRTCALCNRRLSSRRDIYIYRGDTAFCSVECREEKIKQDERKQKLSSIVSNKAEYHHHHHHHPKGHSPSPAVAISEASGNTETIAAS